MSSCSNEKPPAPDSLATEVQGADTGLGDVEKLRSSLSRMAGAKQRAGDIVARLRELRQTGDLLCRSEVAALERLVTCGSYLLYHFYPTVQERRLVSAHFCKTPMLCPLCAIRRGSKTVQTLLQKIEVLLEERPDMVPSLTTLTIKNGDDLGERFNHLRSAYRSVMQARRNQLKQGKGRSELSKLEAGFASFEITKGERTGWHPHVHVLGFGREVPDAEVLSREWHKITGDSFIVESHQVVDRSNGRDPMINACCEVAKYAIKFSSMQPAEVVGAWRTLRGKRMVATFGRFYGMKIPEELTEDPLEGLPYFEELFRFVDGSYWLAQVDDEAA